MGIKPETEPVPVAFEMTPPNHVSSSDTKQAFSAEADAYLCDDSSSTPGQNDLTSVSAGSSRTDDLLEDEDALIQAAANALQGDNTHESVATPCFRGLRYTYLSVILVIYLADGMQGE